MRLAWGERRRPSEPLVVFSAMGLVLLLAGRFFPFDRFPLVSCPLKTFAHIPCFSCGMTRAFVRFTHGEWGSALQVSPLGTLLALLATLFAGYTLLRLTVLKRGIVIETSARESAWLRYGTLTAVAANWAYLIVSGAAS